MKLPTVILIGVMAGPALVETHSLNDYLAEMDYTEVSFSGVIVYDPFRRGGEYGLRLDAGGYFGLQMDSGREDREWVESNCEDGCQVSGRGTVEIRGSSIDISVEELERK